MKLRPVVFHASAYGAWDSICAHGLRTAAQLASDAGVTLDRLRPESISLNGADDFDGAIRDQRPMMRANIAEHLDGVSLDDWLDLLNDRVFLYARQKDLTTMLARYGHEGQDVVTFDTARLLARVASVAEVTDGDPAGPVAWQHCPCRGRDTFVPLARYSGVVADIVDIAIPQGLPDVSGLVRRVVRHHPGGGTPEVIVER